MKILELRFKNINSLYGEWVIDLTTPQYLSEGIFAITGPTGAGKSTILDAICLALYSRTPRLKQVTKSGNEMMSRQTGDCFCEVTFETKKGRFRCHWSQRKAYGRIDGNLGEVKREISDVVTGRILATKKREVAYRIETLTGMDFTRFTRSMLLAQGGFAVFLQAGPDDRGPILEQITGTHIYSEISKGVHERMRKEKNLLDLLRAETEGITILDEQAKANLCTALLDQEKIEKTLGAKNTALTESIEWLERMDRLQNGLKEINLKLKDFNQKMEAFEPDRLRLHKGLKAAEIESHYTLLSSTRKQQEIDLTALEDSKKNHALLKKEAAERQADLEDIKIKGLNALEEAKKEREKIKEARAIDLHISEKQLSLNELVLECKKIETRMSREKEGVIRTSRQRVTLSKTLSGLRHYLDNNERDALLLSELTGISARMKQLKTILDNISTIKARILNSKKESDKACDLYKTGKASLKKKEKKAGDAAESLLKIREELGLLLGDLLLREYRTQKETLLREMAYKREISSLEAKRNRLEEGNPCPLCGAVHHPYITGKLPEMDHTEEKIWTLSGLIQKAEQLENEIKNRETSEKNALESLNQAQKEVVQAHHKSKDAESLLLGCEKELEKEVDLSSGLKKELLSLLEPFHIKKRLDENLDTVLKDLQIRQEKFQECQDKRTGVEKEIGEKKAAIKSLEEIMAHLHQSLTEKQDLLKSRKIELEKWVSERKKCYGNKDTDKEEAGLEKKRVRLEKALEMSRKRRDEKREQIGAVTTLIMTLEKNTTRRKSDLDDLEKTFWHHCKKAGFENEKAFLSCRLSIEKKNELQQIARGLDERKAQLQTRKKEREKTFLSEKSKEITHRSPEDVKKERDGVLLELKAAGEKTGALKQQLLDDKQTKSKLKEKLRLIDAQYRELRRWDSLHALIGSSDGKKYRNFAQGLTFEVMVSHANQQLERMTDRYLLVRNEKEPLELNILDNYQAGEIRSTKNLSGGESFIVSLSLALGLSKMAGRNILQDSLFLDEGFGTLDEDALETSLEALSGLNQEGTLIGIISHVPALKERIHTQITVSPLSGGKSTISGPGVRAMS